MAWQTPKTNWSAADGVRNTDFNRIEENIKYLYDNDAANSNITIFVATTGNDNTGLGTSGSPYATINKAISMLPKNLNGFNATISVAEGVYPGGVTATGFSGGKLIISCNGDITITGNIVVSACSYVNFVASTLEVSSYINVSENSTVQFSCVVDCTGTSQYGVFANTGSTVIFDTSFAKAGSTSAMVFANASTVSLQDVSGSGTTGVGLRAAAGGKISCVDFTAIVGTRYATLSGGRIYSGSQTSAPNY